MMPEAPQELPLDPDAHPSADISEDGLPEPVCQPRSVHHPARLSFVWIGIAFEAGLGIVALGLGWCLGKPILTHLHPRLLPGLLYATTAFPLVGGLFLLLKLDWKAIQELCRFVDD